MPISLSALMWTVEPPEVAFDDETCSVMYERLDTEAGAMQALIMDPNCNASVVHNASHRVIVRMRAEDGKVVIGVPLAADKRLVEGSVGASLTADFGVRAFVALLNALTEETHARPLRGYLTTVDGSTVMWKRGAIPIIIAVLKGTRPVDRATVTELLRNSKASWATEVHDGSLPSTCQAMKEICSDTQTFAPIITSVDGKRRASDAWPPCIGGKPARNIDSTRLTTATQYRSFVSGRSSIRATQRLQAQGFDSRAAATLTGVISATAGPSEDSDDRQRQPNIGILPRWGRFA